MKKLTLGTALYILVIATLLTFGAQECNRHQFIYNHSMIDSNELKQNADTLNPADTISRSSNSCPLDTLKT